jgi:hypothetical protein
VVVQQSQPTAKWAPFILRAMAMLRQLIGGLLR